MRLPAPCEQTSVEDTSSHLTPAPLTIPHYGEAV
jgi:hypothetical protein